MHNRITDAAVTSRGVPLSSNGLASGHVQPITSLTVAAMSGFDGLALNTAAATHPVTVSDDGEDFYVAGLTEGAEYFVGLTGPVLLSSFAYGEATRSLGKVLDGKIQLQLGDVFVYGETDGTNTVGQLSTLNTTAKTSAVAAINELNTLAGAAIPKSVLSAQDAMITASGASTPSGFVVGEGEVVGRAAGGHVDGLSGATLEAIVRAALAAATGATDFNAQSVTGVNSASVTTLSERVAGSGISLATGSEILGVSKVISAAVAYNTVDATLFSVPAGEVWVLEDMWFNTTVSWDGDGSAIIGDAADADGYLVLANASLQTTYDETGGVAGWTTGTRGLKDSNRGAYMAGAAPDAKLTPLRSGPYNILLDNTTGTSTTGAGTAYLRYTRLS